MNVNKGGKKSLHYLNGSWLKPSELNLSVFDLMVSRGFGVFEFLRTYNSKLFRTDDYISRFFKSAGFFGLEIPLNKKTLIGTLQKGIKINGFKETTVKMILSGGIPNNEIVSSKNPSLIILFLPSFKYPTSIYKKGIKAITIYEKRFLPEVKYINQTLAIINLLEAKKEGADEALYVDSKGQFLEGTRSNFFAVINGILVTSRNNVLKGITRKVVLELAGKYNIRKREGPFSVKNIKSFSECFICATDRAIVPVTKINNELISNGNVGPITKTLIQAFHKLTNPDF